MTKSGLIEEVAKRTPHISKKDTEVVVNTIFDSMIDSLKAGDRIEIRGFGTFKVRKRKTRMARNPRTGEAVEVPSRSVPVFKPSKHLRARVEKLDEVGF